MPRLWFTKPATGQESWALKEQQSCLIMSRDYIENHFDDIRNHGSAIEQRLDDSGLSKDGLIHDNENALRLCKEKRCDYILLDDSYSIELEDIVK